MLYLASYGKFQKHVNSLLRLQRLLDTRMTPGKGHILTLGVFNLTNSDIFLFLTSVCNQEETLLDKSQVCVEGYL